MSGTLTGEMKVYRGFGPFFQLLTGGGWIEVTRSRFLANTVFKDLGGLLNLPLFEDITFSRIHGPYEIADRHYRTEGIVFDHPVMSLNAEGTIGFKGALDLRLEVEFLRGTERIPLVAQVMEVLNRLAGTVLNFRVTGTVDNPEISAR